MLERIKRFKKIDAHSHVGYFGSWSNVGITPEELIQQMDEYNVEKSVISTYPIGESIEAVDKYPDRLVGAAWVNPMETGAVDIIRDAVKNHGFLAIKLVRWLARSGNFKVFTWYTAILGAATVIIGVVEKFIH